MERGIFLQRLQSGIKDWPGIQIIFQAARIAGKLVILVRGPVKCGGFNSRDRICVTDLDGKFEQYERSIIPRAKNLAEESSAPSSRTTTWSPYSATRSSMRSALGSRRKKWQDVFPTITTGYAYPWEDIKLKE